ncbi:hypothetical protein [Altererythrobacter sp.]|uniref:hypothetical protein n=1 Tax=Altererythrobacter sp. TaxID=1872480 RepID=UPI003D0348CA
MSQYTFRSSAPDRWSSPRPTSNPLLREHHYGPVLPMEEEPGFFARLFGAR